jgi:hypothetical protein
MDATKNTACIVDEACLPLGCLAIDVLLLSAIVCCWDMFAGPLRRNGQIRNNTFLLTTQQNMKLPKSYEYKTKLLYANPISPKRPVILSP